MIWKQYLILECGAAVLDDAVRRHQVVLELAQRVLEYPVHLGGRKDYVLSQKVSYIVSNNNLRALRKKISRGKL